MGFHIEDIYGSSRLVRQARQAADDVASGDSCRHLEAGCAHARECGATLADYQPQEDVRVQLDPDGHPFCLYLEQP